MNDTWSTAMKYWTCALSTWLPTMMQENVTDCYFTSVLVVNQFEATLYVILLIPSFLH
jgi:hypothetical protein